MYNKYDSKIHGTVMFYSFFVNQFFFFIKNEELIFK